MENALRKAFGARKYRNYIPPENPSAEYNMSFDWKFFNPESNMWSLKTAINDTKDNNGKFFYEMNYDDSIWENVNITHIFNDDNDAGEKKINGSIAYYRKHFSLPASDRGKKVFVEFEGISESVYVYLNGSFIGYCEVVTGTFVFDLSKYLKFGEDNVIAFAVDNTNNMLMGESTKKIKPKTRLASNASIEFQLNSKKFSFIMEGLIKNIKLCVKNNVYITLPFYRNLKTKGTYIYPSEIDIKSRTAVINVEAEIRNESESDKKLSIEIAVVNHDGELVYNFNSAEKLVPKANDTEEEIFTVLVESAHDEQPSPVNTSSRETTFIKTSFKVETIRLWYPEDPYVYKVYVILRDGEEAIDISKVITGFRNVDIIGIRHLQKNNKSTC